MSCPGSKTWGDLWTQRAKYRSLEQNSAGEPSAGRRGDVGPLRAPVVLGGVETPTWAPATL